MKKDPGKTRIYQFDPKRKNKLKSMDYVAPEKKELLRQRKQARKDRRNFRIGAAVLLLVLAAFTYFSMKSW